MNGKIIMISMIIGSAIGGYIPTFFGVGIFSMTSVFAGAAGGLLGIWLSYKFLN